MTWPVPPPMPYGHGPYGQVPPPPPKKSHKGLIIGLSILGVLVIIAIVLAVVLVVALKDTKVATDLKVGDCIADVPTNSRVLALPTVDCAQPHGGEVYAVLTMPDGDYPGQAKINDFQQQCPAKMDRMSPDLAPGETVGVYVLYPTQQTWGQGDRDVTCIATLTPKRTGHLSGT